VWPAQHPWEERLLYSQPHLPQGAPTSPALANLCAYRLDCRLAGLARSVGVEYTRYADDLAFSGRVEFVRRVEGFSTHVAAIVMEEGFQVNHRKTAILRRSMRQLVAGLVVNEQLSVSRKEFDCLKAILANCVRFGAMSQNRAGHANFRQHLMGRVSFVSMVHPSKGKKLQELFDRIQW